MAAPSLPGLTRAAQICLALLVLAGGGALIPVLVSHRATAQGFTRLPSPLVRSYQIFDVGVADVDSDGRLDLFTSNHDYRQQIALGKGGGRFEALSLERVGLNQRVKFGHFEMEREFPPPRAGVHVFWKDALLWIRAEGSAAQASGSISAPTRLTVVEAAGVDAREAADRQPSPVAPDRNIVDGRVTFAFRSAGQLVIRPALRDVPITLELAPDLPLELVHLGWDGAPIDARRIDVGLQDRHGQAWADVNGDGRLDVFISRGGSDGQLRLLKEADQAMVTDELLVATAGPQFASVTGAGVEKRGCSGRNVSWVDFDMDGRLDLFVNCLDRGRVRGRPSVKQLYRQLDGLRFVDVAGPSGLAAPESQFQSLRWVDLDRDGDLDLTGVVGGELHTFVNLGGRFEGPRRLVLDTAAGEDVDQLGNRWRYDRKISVSDFDADGDPDLFIASTGHNWIARNERGVLTRVDPSQLGLPRASITADWADVDNDGRIDLHAVPQGVFTHTADGRFEATGRLRRPWWDRSTSLSTWFDADDDGDLDLLLAVADESWFANDSGGETFWDFEFFRNDAPPRSGITVDVVGDADTPVVGTTVTIVSGSRRWSAQAGEFERSMFSQGLYRLHFGLGDTSGAADVEAVWPDGARQRVKAQAGAVMRFRHSRILAR